MIADGLCMALDNDQLTADGLYYKCYAFLWRKEWLMTGDRLDEPTIDQAKETGEAVEEFLWSILAAHKITDDGKSFLSTMMCTLFSNIDWEKVGRHYFIKTRERYRFTEA